MDPPVFVCFVNKRWIHLYLCMSYYLSQTLVQDPGLGSDHKEGQMPAPYPPFHGLDEGDLGKENDDKDLEEGEHDEVLHPDANVDD